MYLFSPNYGIIGIYIYCVYVQVYEWMIVLCLEVNVCCCFLFLLQVNAAVNSLLAPGSATNTLTPTVITSHALVNTRLSMCGTRVFIHIGVCSQLGGLCRSSSDPLCIAAADKLTRNTFLYSTTDLEFPGTSLICCFVYSCLFKLSLFQIT